MTLLEAISHRQSIRTYSPEPIEASAVAALQSKLEECNRLGNLHLQLVLNEPKAFHGRMAYGSFSGVSNYITLVGKKAADLDERLGYYGEMLVLLAETLGLNTCWVGVTYNKVKDAFQVADGEVIKGVIALGYGAAPGRNHKRKTVEQVSNVSAATPDWFRRGVEAALLAPTAVNQQKFHFEYIPAEDADSLPSVRLTTSFSIVGYTQIDKGIVRSHFDLAAAPASFRWV